MDAIVNFLLAYGYFGMFAAAFLAGSILPFSSEAVMAGLRLVGLNVWPLVVCATIGNTLGGVLNYGMGRLGKDKWIYGMLKTNPERLEKSKNFINKYGAWVGLLSWVPVIGDVITIALGLLRVNFWKTILTIFIGKAFRFIVIGLLLQQI